MVVPGRQKQKIAARPVLWWRSLDSFPQEISIETFEAIRQKSRIEKTG